MRILCYEKFETCIVVYVMLFLVPFTKLLQLNSPYVNDIMYLLLAYISLATPLSPSPLPIAAGVPNVTIQNSSSSAKSSDGGGKAASSNGIPAVVNNDVASLQQEENVSISGSNARLMIMKKLSRKSEVGCYSGVLILIYSREREKRL